MCHDCDQRAAARRGFLSLAAAGVLTALVPAVGRAAAGTAPH